MFDLKKFRESMNLRQTDIAAMFGCSQPNVAIMEREFKDLTIEQLKILSDQYGENTVNKFTIVDNSISLDTKERRMKEEYTEDNTDWTKLVFEQQQSISQLISMVKDLQKENSKLTEALIKSMAV